MSTEQKLNFLIQQDLAKLALAEHLPKSWDRIRSIELFGEASKQKSWLKFIDPPVRLRPNGDRHLEMQVLPWQIGKEKGVSVNYHLIDIASKNTV